jgi:hypothetical protein
MNSDEDPDSECETEENDYPYIEKEDNTGEELVNDLDFVAAVVQKEMNYSSFFTSSTNSIVQVKVNEDIVKENDLSDVSSGVNMNIDDGKDESESSSDTDDDESVNEVSNQKRSTLNEDAIDDISDGEEEQEVFLKPPKTHNEILLYSLPAAPCNVEVLPSDILIAIGTIQEYIAIERIVVIKSNSTSQPVDEGSVICNGDRVVLGKTIEVFGPLHQPYYALQLDPGITDDGAISHIYQTQSETEVGAKTLNALLGHYGDEDDDAPGCQKDTERSGDITDPGEGRNQQLDTTNQCEDSIVNSTDSSLLKRESVISVSLRVGTPLYAVSGHVTFVTPKLLAAAKNGKRAMGSDASNVYDEEVCDCIRTN